jgi:predicted nucleic acid-binding protein
MMEVVPAGASVLLDTSVLLAHLSPDDDVASHAADLVESCLGTGRNAGSISTVTVGELLVRPHRDGHQAVDSMLAFIWSIPDLFIRSVDFLMAAEAARMRATRRVSIPDSLILATGVLIGADVIATNDRAMAASARDLVPDMRVLLLADLAG